MFRMLSISIDALGEASKVRIRNFQGSRSGGPSKYAFNTSCQQRLICRFTFPDYSYAPAQLVKRFFVTAVAFNILTELPDPEINAGLRRISKSAIGVAVPVAAMDENNCLVARQHDIGTSWEVLSVKTETVAHFVKHRSDYPLRLCILRADTRHVPTAACLCDSIHQFWTHPWTRMPCTILPKMSACGRTRSLPHPTSL